MHSNLRPSDAMPVLFRFNYDAHAKFEVAQPMVSPLPWVVKNGPVFGPPCIININEVV